MYYSSFQNDLKSKYQSNHQPCYKVISHLYLVYMEPNDPDGDNNLDRETLDLNHDLDNLNPDIRWIAI